MPLRFIFLLLISSLGGELADSIAQSAARPPFTVDGAPYAIRLISTGHPRTLFAGSVARFQSRTRNINAKGKILTITQTAVTIQEASGRLLTIPLDTVSVITIPRSFPRKLGAVAALAASIGIAVGAVQFYKEEVQGVSATTTFGKVAEASFVSVDVIYFLMSAGCLFGAVQLVKAKKIDLNKGWRMKITGDIVPGNLLHIITRQGEVISQLLVTLVDETSVAGTEYWTDSSGQPNNRKRSILFSDIQEWSRNR